MNKQDKNTSLYLVGIIIMFGILIVVSGQFITPLFQKNKPVNIALNLAKPSLIIDTNKNYTAKLATNLGEIDILLCAKCAPNNVNNFVYLSQKDYYKGTKFHRVVKDLLFQGGDRNTIGTDVTSYGKGKTTYLIEDEVNWDALSLSQEKRDYLASNGYKSAPNLPSKPIAKYVLVMANDGPNTNSSQFFIVTADNTDSRLNDFNGIFTVIGEVVSGFDTINKINSVTVTNADSYIPSSDITIEKVEIIQQ